MNPAARLIQFRAVSSRDLIIVDPKPRNFQTAYRPSYLAQAKRMADNTTALFWVQNGAGRLMNTAPTNRFSIRLSKELTATAYVGGLRG